jgi:hypothetical protein
VEGKPIDRDRVTALARQIFEILPEGVTGLQFYILDCGCIYFQQVFEDGRIDPVVAVYRETGEGPCDVCTLQAVNWRQMVSDFMVVYRTKLQVWMDSGS